MTEADWNSCRDPQKMLDFLLGSGRTSERKLRLFAVACCRTVWHLLHKRGRKAVTLAEDFVEGRANESALELARKGLRQNTYYLVIPRSLPDDSRRAALRAIAAVGYAAAASNVDANMTWRMVTEARLTEDDERDALTVQIEISRLIRDGFGNPFRPRPCIDPAWLTWNNGTVKKLAEAAYGQRSLPDGTLDQARLAVLADALEEAGVTDTLLLEHFRGPGVHVRGCFALDAILGRT